MAGLTVAAKKAIQVILERKHERATEERHQDYQIRKNEGTRIAKEKYRQTMSDPSTIQNSLRALEKEAESLGFSIEWPRYGGQIEVKISYDSDQYEAFLREELKDLKPIEINDLEAQIVHLWTAEEDLEIRPLFNGHLIELQGAATNNAIEADVVE
jgi:hypothetical protein